MKLTIAKFYRVNGSSTQHRGVRPDIAIPSVVDSEEIGESAQKNALPWDEIAATRYRADRNLAALVPELTRRHQERATSDPDYQAFLRDLDFTKEQQDRTTVSLQEKQRRAEHEYIENWQRDRENRYRAAKNLPPLKADDEIPAGKDSAIPDAALDESARIVADLVVLASAPNVQSAVVMGR